MPNIAEEFERFRSGGSIGDEFEAFLASEKVASGKDFSRELEAKGMPASARPKVPGLTPDELGLRVGASKADLSADPEGAAAALGTQGVKQTAQAAKRYETDALAQMAHGGSVIAKNVRPQELSSGAALPFSIARQILKSDEAIGGVGDVALGGFKAAVPVAIPSAARAAVMGGVRAGGKLLAELGGGYLLEQEAPKVAKKLGAGPGVQKTVGVAAGAVPIIAGFNTARKIFSGAKDAGKVAKAHSKSEEEALEQLRKSGLLDEAKPAEVPPAATVTPAAAVPPPVAPQAAVAPKRQRKPKLPKVADNQKPEAPPPVSVVEPPAITPEIVSNDAPKKPLWEMSGKELDDAIAGEKGASKRNLVTLFGEEGAKRYQKLERIANSNSPTRNHKETSAASDEMERMAESAPKELVDRLLYGIGDDSVVDVDLARDIRNGIDLVELADGSPRELGQALKQAIYRIDPKNPTKDPVAYAKMRRAAEIAAAKGWSTKEVTDEAIKGAASQFSDPEDAMFMLERLRPQEGKPASQQPAAPAPKQITAAPDTASRIEAAMQGDRPYSFGRMRGKMPDVQAEEFDRAMLKLADEGKVYLTQHDHGGALTPQQRAETGLIDAGGGKFYGAATKREVSPDRLDSQKGALTLPSKQEVSAAVDDVRANWEDRYIALKEAEDIASSAGKPLADEESPYKLARSYAGSEGITGNRLEELRQIARPAIKSKVWDDAMALRTLERHEELGARLPGYQIPGGKTLQDVAVEKAALTQRLGARMPEVQQVLAKVDGWNSKVLDILEDGGVIDSTIKAQIKKDNQKYLPFQRLEYIEKELANDSIPQGSKAFSVASNNAIHKIEGSEKELADPVEGMVRNVFKAVRLAERNKVAKSMAELASRPEFAAVVVPMKPGQKFIPKNLEPISYLDGGVKKQVLIPSGMADAMRNMSESQADFLTRAAGSFGSLLRSGVTLSPVFMGRNVLRDARTAMVNSRLSGLGFTPADWGRGFVASALRGIPGKDKLYREFMESKGGFGGFYHRSNLRETAKGVTEPATDKIIKTVINPVELMRVIGETFELAPRIGVFNKAQKKGMTPFQSGWKGRNATVDFERRGNMMRVVNMMVPFLNARLQGTLNMYGAVKEAPLATMTRIAAVSGVPFMAMYAWNKMYFPKEYDEVGDHEKENNFVFIHGDRRDENGNLIDAVKIPKGEVDMFLNPVQEFMDWYQGRDPKGWKRTLMQFVSDAVPTPFAREGKGSLTAFTSAVLPPPAKAMQEIVTNKDSYTGRPIVPSYLQPDKSSPKQQYTARTPQYMVKASAALDKVGVEVSPLMLQKMMGTLAGYYGRYAADVSKSPEAMKKSFIGATASAQESKRAEKLANIQRGYSDQSIIVSREADRLFESLEKNKSREAFTAGFNTAMQNIASEVGGEVSPQQRAEIGKKLMDELADAITSKAKGLTYFERTLSRSPADVRAKLIMEELNSSSPDERKKLYQDWTKKRIITPQVIESMAEIITRQPSENTAAARQ